MRGTNAVQFQTIFNLPKLHDLSHVTDLASAPADGESGVFSGQLSRLVDRWHLRPPRLIADFTDEQGRGAKMVAFGPPRQWRERLGEGRVHFRGSLRRYPDGGCTIALQEVLDPRWAGKVKPVYPEGADPEGWHDELPAAVRYLTQALKPLAIPDLLSRLGCSGWTLDQVLAQAHRPVSIAHGKRAQTTLIRLAALLAMKQAAENCPPTSIGARNYDLGSRIMQRCQSLPFALTDEQRRAVARTCADIDGGRPCRHLLMGDVGTGKTAVYALIAAAMADDGGRTAIVVPNEVLVPQVSDDFEQWWPELVLARVTQGTGTVADEVQVAIGTTALFSRLPDECRPDLLIIDEQQKFGRTSPLIPLPTDPFSRSRDRTIRVSWTATAGPRRGGRGAVGSDCLHAQARPPWPHIRG